MERGTRWTLSLGMLVLVLGAGMFAVSGDSAEQPAATSVGLDDIPCETEQQIVACEGSRSTRIESFDGAALLDVNVVYPDSAGPHPLVILGHGWAGTKSTTDAMQAWAKRGYAVVSSTARGFGESCGVKDSRAPTECAEGHIRIDDTRYEVRDAQHVAGLLVDAGIAEPKKIGAAGCSYGGTLSLSLAILRDRVMLTDGSYEAWTSPAGADMELAVASPCVPWGDFVNAMVPNGGTLDYALAPADRSRTPIGIPKTRQLSELVEAGSVTGNLTGPGTSDMARWADRLRAGEPFEGRTGFERLLDELYAFHSPLAIERDGPAAPLLVQNGWSDYLFSAHEGLDVYNRLRADPGEQKIALLLNDFGHPPAQSKPADIQPFRAAQVAWFDHYLLDRGDEPVGGVTTLTQSCPAQAPSQGPTSTPTWAEQRPGEIRRTFDGAQGVTRRSPTVETIDLSYVCASTEDVDADGVASYAMPAAGRGGYTLVGAPTVIADAASSGARTSAQLAGLLWDVAPDGSRRLVTRGVYRPDASGRQVFQLNPIAYRFAEGHVAKLELSAGDETYAQGSTRRFAVTVQDLELRLPVRESQGSASGQVTAPEPHVLPPGYEPAPSTATTPLRR